MNKSRALDALITLTSLLIAFWVYSNIFINADVAWHLEGAKRILTGGDYLNNLLDNNHPVVFLFYAPVIWLSKTKLISMPAAFHLYVLLWILTSLIICYYLINKIYSTKETFTKRFLYYTLLFALVFLPHYTFGQREIIMVTFFAPYLFLSIYTLVSPHSTIPKTLLVIIAVLGGFGIAQNLFYIFLPLFLDGYIIFKKRKFGLHQIILYTVIALIVLLTAIIYPNYFTRIVPLLLCYEPGFNFPITMLLLEISLVISLMTLSIVAFHRKKIKGMADIFLTSAMVIISVIICILEQKIWFYHFYPSLAFTLLLLAMLLAKAHDHHLFKTHNDIQNIVTICLCCAIMFTLAAISLGYLRMNMYAFHHPQNELRQWIEYSQKHFEGKKLFFFVIRLGPAYSLPIYTNATVISPWSNPWFIPNMIKGRGSELFCRPKQDLDLFYAITANSLSKTKPDYIIAEDITQRLYYLNSPFSYFNFFNQNKTIKDLLANYYYVDNFLDFNIYRRKEN